MMLQLKHVVCIVV